MKKTAVVIMLVLSALLFGFSSHATSRVEVVIPDYEVMIDNASVYYADSVYPFLNYKGITYLPLTYEYARAMNIAYSWLPEGKLLIFFHPCDDPLPIYETTQNVKHNDVVMPCYSICLNTEIYDGENLSKIAEYIYSDFDVVSKEGAIIAIDNRRGVITKVK